MRCGSLLQYLMETLSYQMIRWRTDAAEEVRLHWKRTHLDDFTQGKASACAVKKLEEGCSPNVYMKNATPKRWGERRCSA